MYPHNRVLRDQSQDHEDTVGILQVRLGPKLKAEFKAICDGASSDYGKTLTMSGCVRMFAMKMVAQRRQMPEIRHATMVDQVEWATRDVLFYAPVMAAKRHIPSVQESR
jgi:hypothetical protein